MILHFDIFLLINFSLLHTFETTTNPKPIFYFLEFILLYDEIIEQYVNVFIKTRNGKTNRSWINKKTTVFSQNEQP